MQQHPISWRNVGWGRIYLNTINPKPQAQKLRYKISVSDTTLLCSVVQYSKIEYISYSIVCSSWSRGSDSFEEM